MSDFFSGVGGLLGASSGGPSSAFSAPQDQKTTAIFGGARQGASQTLGLAALVAATAAAYYVYRKTRK